MMSSVTPGMRVQIAGCRARHERLGLPQKFLDGLGELLRDAATLIPLDKPPVILTGEYIPENFLLRETDGDWALSGLIDFGDVMTGFGEYDLLVLKRNYADPLVLLPWRVWARLLERVRR